ncbi:HEAT repeat domain-containing protein [Hymenobacter sp. BT491]|uniref:HEAT repeat domain-containing protein n=1 Tax=Hymenobacter sp. BT491 TaxID=2766779 RepID=UPI001653EAD8|nr:HEAT repeat domain-containing protein [Hymenobacter sp. BT491]MBC6991952.1 HEAT repeat domain-containing protein [Hymenobacter sp. BT491]
MDCEGAKDRLLDLLSDELPAAERSAVEMHLAQCPACQQELAATRQLWQTLGKVSVPESSEHLRPRFYAALAEYQAAEQAKQQGVWSGIIQWFKELQGAALGLRLAYSVVLVALGLAVGYGISLTGRSTSAPADQQQVAALSSQVAEMRQALMLSLLENPSATERLRAVSYTKDIPQANNDRVVEALLSTLNNDPNVNVRLATLEALAGMGTDPAVRQGLVRSLPKQESPLVQSAMADVMVQLQVRRSVKPLRQLLQQDNLNEAVKNKIEHSIEFLSNGRPSGHSSPKPYDETRHQPLPDSIAFVVA